MAPRRHRPRRGQQPPRPVAAIVLAAGTSSRMGRPKPLVRVAGRPLLAWVLEAIRKAGIPETVVVLGTHAEQVRSTVPLAGSRVVYNSHPERGLASSLGAGLEGVSKESGAVFIMLGDQPFISPDTLRELRARWSQGDGRIFIPTYRGLRGNPVLFDSSLASEARRIRGDVGCRAMFPNHENEIREVEVSDPGVLVDVDTEAELRAVDEAAGSGGGLQHALELLVAPRVAMHRPGAPKLTARLRRPLDLLAHAQHLREHGEPFAMATVVGRVRPTSGQLGYKAIIRPDRTYVGWVGGSCSEHILIDEALAAMRAGQPRKVRISPDEVPGPVEPDTVQRRMECKSGGTVEIYIEPQMPKPTLVAVGDSPIALAVAALGPMLGYRTLLVAPGVDREDLPEVDEVVAQVRGVAKKLKGPAFAVVATMGKFDETALEELLKGQLSYVGLVASQTRGATVLEALRRRKVPEHDLARIRNPAGIDIAARTPEEVALSIVAEITQVRRTAGPEVPLAVAAARPARVEEDPVCHMSVERSSPLRTAHGGKTYYFCSESCRERFVDAPRQFLRTRSPSKQT